MNRLLLKNFIMQETAPNDARGSKVIHIEPITMLNTIFLSSGGRESSESSHLFGHTVPLHVLEQSMSWAEVNYKTAQRVMWFDIIMKENPKQYHKAAHLLLQNAKFVNSEYSWAPRGRFPTPSQHHCRIELGRSQWCLLNTTKPVIRGEWWAEQQELSERTFIGNHLLYSGVNETLQVVFENFDEGMNAMMAFG